MIASDDRKALLWAKRARLNATGDDRTIINTIIRALEDKIERDREESGYAESRSN